MLRGGSWVLSYHCLLSRWSVLLGLHDWVCKVDGPCPWKHDGMLAHHVLVRIWHRKSLIPSCLHLVAWLRNHFHVWAPFSPSVKWEEQSSWIINFLWHVPFLGTCWCAGPVLGRLKRMTKGIIMALMFTGCLGGTRRCSPSCLCISVFDPHIKHYY